MVQETEKSKNLYVQPMDELRGEGCWRVAGCRATGGQRGEKKWENCNSIINKVYLKIIK